MIEPLHHIDALTWRIRGATPAMERHLSPMLSQILDEALPATFDRYAPSELVIIEELHVQLPTLNPDLLLASWAQALSEAVGQALKAQNIHHPHGNQPKPLPKQALSSRPSSSPTSQPSTPNPSTQVPAERVPLCLLQHYLITGSRPWWHPHPHTPTAWQQHLEVVLSSAAQARELLDSLKNEPAAWKRLAHYFKPKAVLTLLHLAEPKALPSALLAAFDQALYAEPNTASRKLHQALYAWRCHPKTPNAAPWWHAWLRQLRQQDTPWIWQRRWKSQPAPLPQALKKFIAATAKSPSPAKPMDPTTLGAPHQAPTRMVSKPNTKPAEAATPSSPWQPSTGPALGTWHGEEWHVPGAGVILLWPFFARVFGNMNWLMGDDFVDDQARQHALQLLAWWPTGTEAAESEMMLAKWLVGWPADEPLEPTRGLSEAARQEGEKVLDAVLEHWEKLNNSSREGLRRAFLQRSGYLCQGPDQWTLTLEPATHDILLDFLPWGLGLIKLPWLLTTLEVSW